MAEAMTTWSAFRGPEGPRFHRNRKGRMCRAYGARDSTTLLPRPTGRGYLLPRLWRSDRRVPIPTRTLTAHAFTGTHGEIPRLLRRGGLGKPVDLPSAIDLPGSTISRARLTVDPGALSCVETGSRVSVASGAVSCVDLGALLIGSSVVKEQYGARRESRGARSVR